MDGAAVWRSELSEGRRVSDAVRSCRREQEGGREGGKKSRLTGGMHRIE